MRTCSKCGLNKPESQFPLNGRNRSRKLASRRPDCKLCHSASEIERHKSKRAEKNAKLIPKEWDIKTMDEARAHLAFISAYHPDQPWIIRWDGELTSINQATDRQVIREIRAIMERWG